MAKKKQQQSAESLTSQLPTDRLKQEALGFVDAARQRALSAVTDQIGGAAKRLTEYATGSGGSSLLSAVTGKDGKSPAGAAVSAGLSAVKDKVVSAVTGGGGGADDLKVTNIIESIDVGAPVQLVYNQWTQFQDFSTFMKKVENVDQTSQEKLTWKAQVLWSHRTWESTIVEQIPDRRIVWKSQGEKGYVDGAVTFHELAPELTRIILVLEYHPQGLFERTGNIWRAQGRRARLELKHFRRHVMTQAVLRPDEVQGWRGEIHDSEVTQEHEPADSSEKTESGTKQQSTRKRQSGSSSSRSSGSRQSGSSSSNRSRSSRSSQ